VLAARGYRTTRHSFEMEISLAAEPPEPRWPAGIRARPLVAGEESLAHAPTEEALVDHWEFTPTPLDEWLHSATREGHDPSLWFLALAGEEVAGVCLCRVRARGGERIGWCNTLGVRRPWRRRGLGLALLEHAFRELRGRGLARAGLGVDGENPTGAVQLYERAGMHVASRTDTWERELG
jgi:mycothiol synthase